MMVIRMVMRIPFVVVDDDTGNEIVAFRRRGRLFFYLRDWRTKRFIRRLRKVGVKAVATVDYKSPRASYHSIYIDALALVDVPDYQADRLDEYEDIAARRLYRRVEEDFGSVIADMLSEVAFSYHSVNTLCVLNTIEIEIIYAHYTSGGYLKQPRRLSYSETVVV